MTNGNKDFQSNTRVCLLKKYINIILSVKSSLKYFSWCCTLKIIFESNYLQWSIIIAFCLGTFSGFIVIVTINLVELLERFQTVNMVSVKIYVSFDIEIFLRYLSFIFKVLQKYYLFPITFIFFIYSEN